MGTDIVLATIIPSNGARSGGIIFPIAKSIAEAYDSKPGPTARLGAFLMAFLYQCEVIICAMFLTGRAGNLLIQRFASQAAGIDLSYTLDGRRNRAGVGGARCYATASLSHLSSEVRSTPRASEIAQEELDRMGPMKRQEKIMLLVFALVASLWTTTRLHGIDYAAVAMFGVCILLLNGAIDWEDILAERAAWDVFIWYGGMVRLAEALGESGITRRFAEGASSFTSGWQWWAALAIAGLDLLLRSLCVREHFRRTRLQCTLRFFW